MRKLVVLGAVAMLAACGRSDDGGNASAVLPTASPSPGTAVPVLLKASDGAVVHGRYWEAGQPRALILLFHQAGSSKDEYTTIGPRLAANGYSALAIDQRSGGNLFGRNENATAGQGDPSYLKAIPDMEGALALGATKKLPIVVWGSSYSSALAFPVAAKHPNLVRAVLAFSPGEYFDDKTMIARAAAQVAVPVYITDAGTPDERGTSAPIVGAVRKDLLTYYVPKVGVHGSSTLIAAKDPGGSETNWTPVLAFLNKVTP